INGLKCNLNDINLQNVIKSREINKIRLNSTFKKTVNEKVNLIKNSKIQKRCHFYKKKRLCRLEGLCILWM
ncbi:hypothetical protein, partial [Exiguobacterium sp. TNDT2]|uniref:hypothetical protein n=1 Tax=Exiguobacterium sp. TNDT2 TaxID=2233531 RepID=UPI001E39654E